MTWVGRYKSGIPWGRCWQWREGIGVHQIILFLLYLLFQGGGWLTAVVDSSGVFSGSKVAFVYPDLETALVGNWQDGKMVAAFPAILTSIDMVAGIPEPTFTLTMKEPAVGLSISTETSVGAGPLVRDPYEERSCNVQSSRVEGGGEGLYALRDLKPGEVVIILCWIFHSG